MFDVLLSVVISFTITFLAIPAIIRVAEQKKLFDVPNARKIHREMIPALGGLGIFAGFLLACLLSAGFRESPELQYFIAASIVVFFLGLKDDILVISPVKKFLGQVAAATFIIYKGGIQISSMHGFLGVYELPQMFSLLLTYFTVLVIINSFNLIDGIDGLAGTLGIIASSIFGFYFLKAGLSAYAIMGFSLAGSLAAFLIFNYNPAKIFMGDTGSMLIGLVNAVLVLKFISIAEEPGVTFPVVASPAIGFTALLIPLLDTLRVFAIRIYHQRSPFSPDRNHIHHLMLDKGWSHTTITCTLSVFSVIFVAAAYYCRDYGCTLVILAGIVIFFSGIAALYYTSPHPGIFVSQPSAVVKLEEEQANVTKIVPINKEVLLEKENG
jgi:UDP-N-acetylmuramyl pentapeptide phosphotransferase/UDP-N-acetylglucosamine-1-phosphate transferase